MKLHQLARLIGCPGPEGAAPEVTGISEDSRRIRPGALFAALPGAHTDGHAHIADAVARGAVAVLGGAAAPAGNAVPYLYTPDPRWACGLIAHALAGDPTRDMRVIGITGTNGKSSTLLFIDSILAACGHKTARVGTLGYVVAGAPRPAPLTTPFAEDLAALFREAKTAGVTHAAMEVSSHALDQERVAGIAFAAAAFTNLTQDHLDYHGTMDAYLKAKLKLFERVSGPDAFTAVNAGDPHAPAFIGASRGTCYTYGPGGLCRADAIEPGMRHTAFEAVTPWGTVPIRLNLVGLHNVANALCAITVAGGLGCPPEGIADGLAAVDAVPGRFEQVDAGQAFQVVVDYAHTEDGLLNVLRAARAICSGRVICVFGCGGDRDKTKRPRMGQAATNLADFSIVTSDNPRTEDPEAILRDIEAGMTAAARGTDYVVIADRAEAIRAAIARAEPGDLVLIAGKGHENYQILGTTRIHFDDREEARAAILERLGGD